MAPDPKIFSPISPNPRGNFVFSLVPMPLCQAQQGKGGGWSHGKGSSSPEGGGWGFQEIIFFGSVCPISPLLFFKLLCLNGGEGRRCGGQAGRPGVGGAVGGGHPRHRQRPLRTCRPPVRRPSPVGSVGRLGGWWTQGVREFRVSPPGRRPGPHPPPLFTLHPWVRPVHCPLRIPHLSTDVSPIFPIFDPMPRSSE